MIFIVLLLVVTGTESEFRWDKWSWALPQEPIAYYFRKHYQEMPVRERSPTLECECPPHKECVVDFKINEAAPEFLNLRGLIKDDEMRRYNREIKAIQELENQNLKKRRSANDVAVDECCCPPRTEMMPTFITDKLFDDAIERISNDYNKNK